MDVEMLRDMVRHQIWADAEHWKTLRANAALLEDPEIRQRLNHMATASRWLAGLTRGETPDRSQMKEAASIEEIETAMTQAQEGLTAALGSDLEQTIALPRGPKGPFEAPAGVLLLQIVLHSQHHRAQNASRMRALGTTPPMTDYVVWYALGRP